MIGTIVNTDYRTLRWDDSMRATVETKQQISLRERKGTLCERCCLQLSCKTLKTLRDLTEREGAVAGVERCDSFVVGLRFIDKTGTDLPRFNTFRFGKAWSERVWPGNQVGLIDGDGRLYGTATVAAVRVLEKDAALRRFARQNHLMLPIKQTRAEAAERLRKTLRNLYGQLVVSNNTHITVIELATGDG